MRQAAQGDDVKVHYTGKLASGETFDSSRDGEPMEVRIGAGRLIEDFEKALLGMAEGEVKEVTIPPEDAYGLRQDALVHTVAREQLPPDLDLAVGMQLEARD
ncbi:MAG: FKBP-type peptidyl-prolyl cis-trans isomerase, partial [Alphaproteobacteria bacterium]